MRRLHTPRQAQSLSLVVLVPFFGIYDATYGVLGVQAQLIPAADGTGTIVTQTDDSGSPQFNIEQGSLSADQSNLFHSFEAFSLQSEETAHFIAPSTVQNILTRVSGGETSIINGQLAVSGAAQPNLFLINPAGVLFGPDATVNLPANLTVTTADALGFEQGMFSASEANAYNALVGAPTGEFSFTDEAGGIVNEGELTLSPEASLSLMGNTVVNTGRLSAPGGEIAIAAVPPESTLRLSQVNHLLNLEIDTAHPNWNGQSLNPLTLPTLLTQTEATQADRLTLEPNGTATLTTDLPSGSALISGTVTTSSENAGGAIDVLGNQVALLDATLSANSPYAGGTIRIGGDYQGQETLPSAAQTLIDSATTIAASAAQTGDGGRVIVWADDTTQYLGDISATGGAIAGNGGFVEVSGKKHLNFQGTVDTHAPHGQIGSLLLDPENITIVNGFTAADDEQISDGQVFAEEGTQFTLSERTLANLSGNTAITLEATNNITVGPLADKTLAFRPGTAPITFRADADSDGIGDFSIPSDHTIISPGRSLSISGANLQLGDLNTAAAIQGGDITLTATGNITTGNIESFAVSQAEPLSPKGGDITLTANGDITANVISTENTIQSGDLTITSQNGSITATEIPGPDSNSTVTLSAPLTISVAGETIQGPPLSPSVPIPSEQPQPDPSQTTDSLLTTDPLENKPSNMQAAGIAQIGVLSATPQADSDTANSGAAKAKSASSGAQRTELTDSAANAILAETETQQTAAFGTYFNRNFEPETVEIAATKQLLLDIETQTSSRSAIIYIKAPTLEADKPLENPSEETLEISLEAAPAGSFELMLITASGAPVKFILPKLTHSELLETVNRFRSDLLTSVRRGGTPYLSSAQQLYQWLIEPLEADLKTAEIDNLVFKLDEGLRTLPLAALHNKEQFLIEQYSLGIIPSIGLTDSGYTSLTDATVLAMGASEFQQLKPLPAVPLELQEITRQWPTRTFLNNTFTRQNLIQQQAQTPAQIVHLATHAEFNAGTVNNSYIQLWDEKLRLSELDQMGWDDPAFSLLVLSACSTAMGNPDAELGFAGLALASGAESVLASLWAVDDVGTLGLTGSFYHRLKNAPTKAKALQSAQLALLNGGLAIDGGQLLNTPDNTALPLPSDLGTLEMRDFSHPYYWSSFTLIGSPW